MVFDRGLDLLFDRLSELLCKDVIHMLEGVRAEAIEVEVLNQPDGVVDDRFSRIGVVVVEVGHVRREPAVDAVVVPVIRGAGILGIEPAVVLVGLIKRRLAVDMVRDKVGNDPDAFFMRFIDKFAQFGHGSESGIDAFVFKAVIVVKVVSRGERMVGVIAGEVVVVLLGRNGSALAFVVGVHDRGADPDRVDAHPGKVAVIELVDDPAEVAALPLFKVPVHMREFA